MGNWSSLLQQKNANMVKNELVWAFGLGIRSWLVGNSHNRLDALNIIPKKLFKI